MQEKQGSTCYDTGMGYTETRNRINRNPQQARSTSTGPQGSPQQNLLALFRSSSGRRPDIAPTQQKIRGITGRELELTVLSVTF